jgi:hypothetical protein
MKRPIAHPTKPPDMSWLLDVTQLRQPLVNEHERIGAEFLKVIYPPEFSLAAL